MNDETFQKRLEATFRQEAREHIELFTASLMEMERQSGEPLARLVEQAFREVHSLKGAARAVNASRIESLCQSLESCFSCIKHGRLHLRADMLDVFHDAINLVSQSLDDGDSVTSAALKALRDRLVDLEAGAGAESPCIEVPPARPEAPEAAPAEAPAAPSRFETIRAAAADIDAVYRYAEEIAALSESLIEQTQRLGRLAHQVEPKGATSTRTLPETRLLSGRSGAGAVLKQGLDEGQRALASASSELRLVWKGYRDLARRLEVSTDHLLAKIKSIDMLPFSTLLEPLPKVVRDLASAQGKRIAVDLRGERVQVDRQILESLREPLLHLLRNAVDHGIEDAEERRRLGKPESATISIDIGAVAGGQVQLTLRDDGRGVNFGAVRQRALQMGLASGEAVAAMDDEDSGGLIFRSGLSTSSFISEISGRGLGLAIVREKVEAMGGAIRCESTAGRGTAFHLSLPVTLATFRAVEVLLGDSVFLVPGTHVVQALRLAPSEIRTATNRRTICFDGLNIALLPLAQVLGVYEVREGGAQARQPILVVSHGGTRIGLEVSQFRCEREVIMKSLGSQLRRVRNIAGAAILPGGRLALVLNVPDLIKTAATSPVAAALPQRSAREEAASVLVVDDSITSRSLLRDILRSAGYRVSTAVDGTDAYTQLREASFDVVVSDVDMPRMNGFELTARIRSHPELSQTPVILVTALASREDRERGIDVGANAYIIKSSFDQSDLLQILKRFT